uniref:Uncharacterized protein n=1 Tax=Caenorhabditis japonica TaxID=281687 RepID=A0A8R1E9R2_CAEJA
MTWSGLHNSLDRVWIHVIGSPDALFESIVVPLSFHSVKTIMDYHCDIPLVLTLFKPDFVGINQFTNCADNFPFIRFTGSTTAVSPIASVSLMRL